MTAAPATATIEAHWGNPVTGGKEKLLVYSSVSLLHVNLLYFSCCLGGKQSDFRGRDLWFKTYHRRVVSMGETNLLSHYSAG